MFRHTQWTCGGFLIVLEIRVPLINCSLQTWSFSKSRQQTIIDDLVSFQRNITALKEQLRTDGDSLMKRTFNKRRLEILDDPEDDCQLPNVQESLLRKFNDCMYKSASCTSKRECL